MGKILTSWKEIAAYLGKGVRTVQRWEVELDLPVRRPNGRDRQIVMAFTDELDNWAKGPRATSNGSWTEQLVHVREMAASLAEQIARLAEISQKLVACIERAPQNSLLLNNHDLVNVVAPVRDFGRSASRVVVKRARADCDRAVAD